jgi:hypothetical protein
MTVLTLALLAGSQPAAPRLAPVHQIGPQSRRQSPHTPCAPLVRTDALTLTWQKADRHKRSAPTSSSHTPWPNPHSASGTAAAPLPAISCLGAFRPPAARARGEVRHCRQPKTLYGAYRCQEKTRHVVSSFCHVVRLHCGTAALLLGCAERPEPRSRVRRRRRGA